MTGTLAGLAALLFVAQSAGPATPGHPALWEIGRAHV